MFAKENSEPFKHYKERLTTHPYDSVISYEITEKTDEMVTIHYKLKKSEDIELSYRVLHMSDVQKMYQENNKIDLDRCYIESFDATQLIDEEDEKILFSSFSAECAFFSKTTNFSDVNFGNAGVSFLGTIFDEGDLLFDFSIFCDKRVSFEKVTCGNGKTSFLGTDFGGGETSFFGMNFADGNVTFDRSHFDTGNVTFKKAKFGNGDVSFVESDFGDGDVCFEDTNFGNGEIWFGRTTFGKGKVLFEKTNFGDGNVTFWETSFGEGAASFNKSKFGKGEVSFCGTIFGDDYVWFDDVDFGKGSVSFMGTNFGNSDVRFYRSSFEDGDVSFFSSIFGKSEVRFWRCNFGDGELNFTGVMASETNIMFRGCKLLNHEVFRFHHVKTLEIIDCIIDGVLLLNSEKREMVHIDELSFLNTKNLGSIFIDWETARNAIASYSGLSNEKAEDVNHKKANQMKMLKENFHNLGEYDSEDEAFAEYMNYRRKTKPPLFRFPSWILSAISGYGTKPVRLFVTMLVVILMFGFVFSGMVPLVEMVGKESFGQTFNGLPRGLYFSMITFMTIGYGDISPANNLTAILAGLEGFAGLFLMSYFTVAVVRKTLR